MQREIKFRGKQINTGNWLFGDLVYVESKPYIFSPDDLDSPDRYVVHPDTVGQYTGLKDKNVQEIYEGDILKRMCYVPGSITHEKKECRSQIYFSATTNPPGWRVKNTTKTGGWSAPISSSKNFNNEALIIGNIHDNPELLKTEE